jgi:hypothetical protein
VSVLAAKFMIQPGVWGHIATPASKRASESLFSRGALKAQAQEFLQAAANFNAKRGEGGTFPMARLSHLPIASVAPRTVY